MTDYIPSMLSDSPREKCLSDQMMISPVLSAVIYLEILLSSHAATASAKPA